MHQNKKIKEFNVIVNRNIGFRTTCFRKICKVWIQLVAKYCNFWEGKDAPYYYNERGNVGLFNAAAWKAGFIALEECTQNKKGQKGRLDLYVANRDGQFEEYIEAKQTWSFSNLENKLKVVKKDTTRIPKEKGEYWRDGMLFICPKFTKTEMKNLPKLIKQILEKPDFEKADLVAYTFPQKVRKLTGGGKYRECYYPGIFCLIKHID